MRHGETFDACVSLRYMFVGVRFRTIIESLQERPRLQRQEEVVFNTLVNSGLLDETPRRTSPSGWSCPTPR
eukprot:763100-Alexandrium_andersonii.AAC.1